MSIYKSSSLAMLPTAYKDGKLYSIRPVEQLGSELVTNGDFSSASDWTFSGGGVAISGGKLNFTGTTREATQSISVVNTKTYRVSYEVSNFSSGSVRAEIGSSTGAVRTANGIYSEYIVASGANTIQIDAVSFFTGSIDNVSVKEVLVANGDFTFSRGSNLAATRISASQLIEKGRENLLLQSNQFDTTWANSSTSETGGQSGYDGSNDAWLLTKTAASGYIVQSISSNAVQTFSVYAKAGSLDFISLFIIASGNQNVYFDLQNGTIGSSVYGNEIDAKITSVGNGFYRCSVSVNTSISSVRIYPADADNDVSGTSGNIYIQDAQLESGLVATDVISTGASTAQAGILEDLPRLDYSGGASCSSLLLEPQRSNLVDDYSGYTWDSFNGAAISFTGTERSPEGFTNAVTWTFGGSSGEVVQRSSISISNSTTYTISGYFKLTSGTLTSGSNQIKGLDGLSGGSVSLNTLTDQWQRLTFSVTSSSTSGRVQLRCDNSATIQVYGLQLESGSYETSVIPTYGSAVTRSQDVCSGAGDASLFNVNGGVLFGEFSALADDLTFRQFGIAGTNGNEVNLSLDAVSNRIGGIVRSSGTYYTTDFVVSDTTQTLKAALKYEGASVKLFVNGALADTNISATAPANLSEFNYAIGTTNSNKFYGRMNQTLVFPTALTDAECIALTTI